MISAAAVHARRFARAAQALHRLLYGMGEGERAEMAAEARHAAMQSRLTNLGVLKLAADTLAEPELYRTTARYLLTD